MTIDINSLDNEQRAFFEEQTKSGSTFELIERRDALRNSLSKEHGLRDNHKAGILTLNELHNRINPQPTPADLEFQANTDLVKVAQRYRNEGSDHVAERILDGAGLTLDYLEPRPFDEALDKREEDCRVEYVKKRELAISDLCLRRGIPKREATECFDGGSSPRGGTLDSALRKQVNRNHAFHAGRPF